MTMNGTHYIYIVALILVLASCHATIHEHPVLDGFAPAEEATVRRRRVVLDVRDAAPPYTMYKHVAYDASGTAQHRLLEPVEARRGQVPEGYERRVTLVVEHEGRTLGRVLMGERDSVDLAAEAGHYTVMAWMDYRPIGHEQDWLYDTSLLTQIMTHTQRLPADTHLHHALAAVLEFDVPPPAPTDTTMRVTVPLIHTQARFRLAPDDAGRFRRYYPELEQATVRVTYTQYVAVGFNTVTHETNYVISSYTHHTYTLHDFESVHYVLCPRGREMVVKADVTYLRPDGYELAHAADITIPLCQGRETLVTGPLLTRLGTETDDGGMAIDDSFTQETLIHF